MNYWGAFEVSLGCWGKQWGQELCAYVAGKVLQELTWKQEWIAGAGGAPVAVGLAMEGAQVTVNQESLLGFYYWELGKEFWTLWRRVCV